MNENLIFSTARELGELLAKKEITAVEVAQAFLDRAEDKKDLGIYLQLDPVSVLEQARQSDERRAKGAELGPMDGIPVSIKDNICVKDEKTTCASRILENFVAPYDAFIIERLKSAGMVLFGRTNMDEFAMGSSTENSAFQITRNPWNPDCVPGGSSGGAAASVAASTVPLAIGSDTGGSIRQPAALCGVVGIKPTYGRVSRYGLVAFASSLDQIGAFGKTAEDASLLLNILGGYDKRDSTSNPEADQKPVIPEINKFSDADWKKLRVGVILPEPGAAGFDSDVLDATNRAVEEIRSRGAKIVPIKTKFWDYSIPIYYILATAEASSNLSRYDGVRYGRRSENVENILDLYVRSRTEGFGPEVKRRILLGTFVLSSGYYDAYYKSAQKARKMIQQEYAGFFKDVDAILQPTSPSTAFRIGEKSSDPLAMYQSDLLTISVNLAGIPALSIPAGVDQKGLPIGLQLSAAHYNENFLLNLADAMLDIPDFALNYERMSANTLSATSVTSKETQKKTKSSGKSTKQKGLNTDLTIVEVSRTEKGLEDYSNEKNVPIKKKTTKKNGKEVKEGKESSQKKKAAKKAAKKLVKKAAKKKTKKENSSDKSKKKAVNKKTKKKIKTDKKKIANKAKKKSNKSSNKTITKKTNQKSKDTKAKATGTTVRKAVKKKVAGKSAGPNVKSTLKESASRAGKSANPKEKETKKMAKKKAKKKVTKKKAAKKKVAKKKVAKKKVTKKKTKKKVAKKKTKKKVAKKKTKKKVAKKKTKKKVAK